MDLRRITVRVEVCSEEQADRFMRQRRCASKSGAVKRWALLASPVRENQPLHGASRVLLSPIQVRSELVMSISQHCRKLHFGLYASGFRWSSRIRTAHLIRGTR